MADNCGLAKYVLSCLIRTGLVTVAVAVGLEISLDESGLASPLLSKLVVSSTVAERFSFFDPPSTESIFLC